MDVNVGGLKTASFPSFSRAYFKENHSQSAPLHWTRALRIVKALTHFEFSNFYLTLLLNIYLLRLCIGDLRSDSLSPSSKLVKTVPRPERSLTLQHTSTSNTPRKELSRSIYPFN